MKDFFSSDDFDFKNIENICKDTVELNDTVFTMVQCNEACEIEFSSENASCGAKAIFAQ